MGHAEGTVSTSKDKTARGVKNYKSKQEMMGDKTGEATLNLHTSKLLGLGGKEGQRKTHKLL